MSQGLTKTKRRIQSVTSTKKITKAMNLVATVKLKRWKNNMDNIISYLSVMEEIISSCVGSVSSESELPEFQKYPNAKGNLYVVVSSTLGLCGGYNYNLFRFVNSIITKDDKILVIGTKGFSRLSREEFDVDDNYVLFLDKFDYQKVSTLKDDLLDLYKSGNYKSVKMITTTYKNSLTFIPREINIFPLENLTKNESDDSVIFEPSKKEVISLIIPKYLETLIYGHLTEAMVCEQASRRNAMDNATDNAEELLDKLKIEFNKARQASITQEITEVVGGSINK